MVEKKKTTKKAGSTAKARKAVPKRTARASAKPGKAVRATGSPRLELPVPAAPREETTPEEAAAPQPETVLPPFGPSPLGVHDLRPAFGATRSRKRVGRGPGSGHGKTAGRGNKGQKSRSGFRRLRGFEGGQMPLHRRVPKRGFTSVFRVEYDLVNLSDLDRFESGAKVTPEMLASHRLAHGRRPVKILGDGQIGKPLEVSAHKFSAAAQAKIEAAGGRCEVIPR